MPTVSELAAQLAAQLENALRPYVGAGVVDTTVVQKISKSILSYLPMKPSMPAGFWRQCGWPIPDDVADGVEYELKLDAVTADEVCKDRVIIALTLIPRNSFILDITV